MLRRSSCLLLLFLVAACTRNALIRPYLTDHCEQLTSVSAVEAAECSTKNSIETHPSFKLGFVEFDDQGWFYNHNQMHRLLDDLNQVATEGERDLLVVAFVHGWRHNADYNDPNVQAFRATLALLAKAEDLKKAGDQRRAVYGIYVGWRGLSLKGSSLWESLSFYGRKTAADHVAKGSVRELFARLRYFAQKQNEKKRKAYGAQNLGHKPPLKVRLVILGHSFGGLILYSAISEYLMYSGIANPEEGNKTLVKPFADLVFLINPALEASRYEALHHVAIRRNYKPGQKPVFIAVTTANDWATRYAFPLGRWINSALENERNNPIQKEANKNTLGHVERYRTHTLTTCDDAQSADSDAGDPGACGCPGWKGDHATDQAPLVALSALEDDMRRESLKTLAFYQKWRDPRTGRLRSGWIRHFCGGLVLRHDAANGNKDPENPFWVVYTDGSVIDGHGGFTTPQFRNFAHQILLEREDLLLDTEQ